MMGLYYVKDDLTAKYDWFGTFPNDAVARRAFLTACEAAGVPKADISLYVCGYFDSNTGYIDTNATDIGNMPAYICRGNANE